MDNLKWWLVRYGQEGCGDYGCGGYTDAKYIVAAHTKEEVAAMFPRETYEEQPTITEWTELPDLKRKKKPFIWKEWP